MEVDGGGGAEGRDEPRKPEAAERRAVGLQTADADVERRCSHQMVRCVRSRKRVEACSISQPDASAGMSATQMRSVRARTCMRKPMHAGSWKTPGAGWMPRDVSVAVKAWHCRLWPDSQPAR